MRQFAGEASNMKSMVNQAVAAAEKQGVKVGSTAAKAELQATLDKFSRVNAQSDINAVKKIWDELVTNPIIKNLDSNLLKKYL